MFLCICKAVRVSEAVDAARAGFDSPESIKEFFGFDDEECCGRCAKNIEAVTALVHLELKRRETAGVRSAVAAAMGA